MSGKRVCWLSGVLCVVGLAAGRGLAEEVSFAPVVHYPAGECPIGLAACDLDGDGDLDLAVSSKLTSGVLFNDGTGAFGDPVTFNDLFALSVACGDIDGDGDNDIVVGNGKTYGSTLLINDGSGTFTAVEGPAVAPETIVAYPRGTSLCDFDSDGDLDLGFATGYEDTEKKIEIFRNRGDGTFTHGRAFDVIFRTRDLNGIACADLEGDGNSDFIGYAHAFRDFIVIGSLPRGRFHWRHMHVRAHPVDVAFGELDGEPGIDAVAVHRGHEGPPSRRSGAFVLKNDGVGNLSIWLDLDVPHETVAAVTLGHIDSDGLLDIVFSTNSTHFGAKLKIFLQRDGTFVHAASVPGNGHANILGADLNGDGLDDVVIPGESSNVISVFINTTGQP